MTPRRPQTAPTIRLGEVALKLPSLPGIAPDRLAAEIETALARHPIAASQSADLGAIRLPAIQARPGEGAQSLATRIAASIAKTISKTGEGA